MIYTLTICVGIFLGICGQVRQADYPRYEACAKERDIIAKQNITYAICTPRDSLK